MQCRNTQKKLPVFEYLLTISQYKAQFVVELQHPDVQNAPYKIMQWMESVQSIRILPSYLQIKINN